MINEITTNTSNSNYLSKRHKCHITLSLSQHVLKMHVLQCKRKRWKLTPHANSMFNNHVTQSGPFTVDAIGSSKCTILKCIPLMLN